MFTIKLFNRAFLLGGFVTLFACSHKVQLSESKRVSKSLGFSLRYTDSLTANNNQIEFAESMRLTSYSLYRFIYYPKAYLNFFEKERVSSPYVNYSDLIRFYGTDTLQKIKKNVTNSEIIFLLGRNFQGDLKLVADKNRNYSFFDDSIYSIKQVFPNKIPSIADIELLPTIRINNIKEYYKKSKRESSLVLQPFPFIVKHSTTGQSDTAFHLGVISGQYVTGTFQYKSKKYEVLIRNTMLPFINYNTRFFDVKVIPPVDDPLFSKYNDLTYHLGDTIKLDKKFFIIKKISPFLKHITFKKVNGNTQKT